MGREALRRGAATIGMGMASGAGLVLLLILLGVPRTAGRPGSWSDLGPLHLVLTQVAGLSLVVAGLMTLWVLRPARVGLVAMLAGLAWLAPDLVGAQAAGDPSRSVALLGGPLLLPAIAIVVVEVGGRPARRARVVLTGLLALTASLTVARTITLDPFRDTSCWTFCYPHVNALLIGGRSWADLQRLLTAAWTMLAVVGWAGLTAWAARAIRRPDLAGPPVRRVLWAGLVVGAAAMVWSAEAWLRRTDPPDPTASGWLWPVRAALGLGLVTLAVSLVRLVLDTARRSQALRRSLQTLGSVPEPGELRLALARALDDPTLTVSYAVEDGRFVDAAGATVAAPVARPGRGLTTIERGGVPIAIVAHDAALDGPMLIREIGAAARLAVDNERLRASVLARVADLRASQARLVAVADEERRRLERDLHDGAQQRLLALSFEIRVALAASRGADDTALAERLTRADALAQTAIAELRSLAHGIFPAILRDTGLAPALATLMDDAPLPVELEVHYRGRCAAPAEVAAYHVVADALLQATRSGASHFAVRLDSADGVLVVEVAHDGEVRSDAGARVVDRVGAVGGRLESVVAGAAAGPRMRVELPCE